MLVSESEEINNWDLVLGTRRTSNKQEVGVATRVSIYEVYVVPVSGDGFYCDKNKISKIMAIPEHFSPKQLQLIVDGKLKDGDKVLVECVKSKHPNFDAPFIEPEIYNENEKTRFYFINLSSSNHITLHKLEEKMVPLSLVKKAFLAGNEYEPFGLQAEKYWNKWSEDQIK